MSTTVLMTLALLVGLGAPNTRPDATLRSGLCDWRIARLNTEAYVGEAIALLAMPDGRQGCVSSAAGVLGPTTDPRATAALLAYVREEVVRIDPDRRTFRSQNVSAVIAALGRRWARQRAERRDVPPETADEDRALATLRDTRSLIGDGSGERPSDLGSRLEQVQRFATGALASGLEPEALPDFVTRVLRRPRPPIGITVAPDATGAPELRISNPTGAPPVFLSLQDSSLPVAYDARLPDGSWREVLGWNWSFCGNSYDRSARIGAGQTQAFPLRLPRAGTPARMRARLPWRNVETLQAVGGVTLSTEFDGYYDAEALTLVGYRGRRLDKFGSPELLDLVAGRGLPDVRAEKQAQVRLDALHLLFEREDPGAPEAARRFLEGAQAAPEVQSFVRQLCRRWPETARPLIRAAIENPEAQNRRAILGAAPACKAFSALLPRLRIPDDPDLSLIVELLRGRLVDGFWAPAADALARLARNPKTPPAVAETAAKTVDRYGRDAVHVGWFLQSGALRVNVDARTERPMQGCVAHPGTGCLGFSLVDATGETVSYLPRPDTGTRLEGPKLFHFSVDLPKDVPDGRYRFVAEPDLRIDGLVVPDAFGMLRRESGRWQPDPRGAASYVR